MEVIRIKYVPSAVAGDSADLGRLAEVLRLAGCKVSQATLNSGSWFEVEVPDGIERRLTRNAGTKRVALPEGSPLDGMDEAQAMAWCRSHSVREAADALGVAESTAYARMRRGRVLPTR